ALNKVLKDIIIKSRNLQGQRAEYVPGWDCHGLPIEHKVTTDLKKKGKVVPPLVLRKICREYAAKWLDVQRSEFKRLGVMGVWDEPYMTMNPLYEAATARELGNFMAKGSVVRGKKPVHWCCDCKTALAEAEVEYFDHSSPSIYVRFPLTDEGVSRFVQGSKPDKTFIVIWTTTPWTLPDNMAVAVHPDFEYVFVRVDGEIYVLAEGMLEACAALFGWENYDIDTRVKGAELAGLVARHPFYDRPSPVLTADYVTLEAGTGCVHTAPGHGREDYDTGMRNGLDIYSPLNDEGQFYNEVEFFAGLSVFEANPEVILKLKEFGHLLASKKIEHSYPHCWRCKEPVIFRATTQWFISMEENDLRTRALTAIKDQVSWIPAWGKDRIHSMIENRPDWCISRQRNWGVPILALLCEDCDESWFGTDWVMSIVDKFKKHPTGCDYWYEAEMSELVPVGLTCPKCGGTHWKRETDILDVWFDSGTSFAAVVEQRPELSFPADLYLEGSDQHRGWFHSSLLASVGTRGTPPYKTVLTHGYVVDGEGRKMSKSIGNVLAPQEIIDKYGAELLRLWVSAVNYQEDIRISDEIMTRLVDAYRRIRNTCKFLLSNLWDLTLDDLLAPNALLEVDRFALDLIHRRHLEIQAAYGSFEFHRVYQALQGTCVTELSAFFLDIAKDRLYVESATSRERRSAQTVIFHALNMLMINMAPVLSFTADEVFSYVPDALKPGVDTVFALHPNIPDPGLSSEERGRWELLLDLRGEVTKAIEPKRRDGVIGKPLDAKITIHAPEMVQEALKGLDLREFFIVSQALVADASDAPSEAFVSEEIQKLAILVERAEGAKCERCWRYDTELGTNPEHPSACPRCTAVLAEG
ncbi:MAG: isoleucine--tRNA ligase, partial [Proteobacteria bacterium]|nr:isoleucine--tRNA ligase [Pseudomonadota bacterium]